MDEDKVNNILNNLYKNAKELDDLFHEINETKNQEELTKLGKLFDRHHNSQTLMHVQNLNVWESEGYKVQDFS